MVEKKADCHIKKLKFDNDIEYTLRDFNDFCEKEGIQHN